MKLFNLFKTFARDEDGAVTVDWVVLTAAIVGLGIAVLTSVSTGVQGLGDKISTEVDSATMIGAGVVGYDGPGGADAGDGG